MQLYLSSTGMSPLPWGNRIKLRSQLHKASQPICFYSILKKKDTQLPLGWLAKLAARSFSVGDYKQYDSMHEHRDPCCSIQLNPHPVLWGLHGPGRMEMGGSEWSEHTSFPNGWKIWLCYKCCLNFMLWVSETVTFAHTHFSSFQKKATNCIADGKKVSLY